MNVRQKLENWEGIIWLLPDHKTIHVAMGQRVEVDGKPAIFPFLIDDVPIEP